MNTIVLLKPKCRNLHGPTKIRWNILMCENLIVLMSKIIIKMTISNSKQINQSLSSCEAPTMFSIQDSIL